MAKAYQITTYLLIILGIGHIVLTPQFYSELSQDAVWFAGSGLTVLYLGLLNLVVLQSPGRLVINLGILSNVLGLGFIILVVQVVPEFQAFIGLVAILIALIGSVLSRNQSSN